MVNRSLVNKSLVVDKGLEMKYLEVNVVLYEDYLVVVSTVVLWY